jgi:hypothetical protein
LGGRRPGRVHLEHEGGATLPCEERGEPVPWHVAAARRKVEIQSQRVELGRAGVPTAGSEVVMEMEEDDAIEDGLDQLQRVGASLPGDDVRVADVDQSPTAGEEIRLAIVLRISGVKERASGLG